MLRNRTISLSPPGIVPVVLLSQGLVTVGLGTFGVLYNLYLSAMGLSLAFIGSFNAISILAIGISAIPIGASARVSSPKRVLATGAFLLAGVQVLLATATEGSHILLVGIAWGVAQALCTVSVGPLISEGVPRADRASVFGKLYATWAFATGVGSILGGAVPGVLARSFSIGTANGVEAFRGALLIATAVTLLGGPLLLLPVKRAVAAELESRTQMPAGSGWAMATVPRLLTGVVITMGVYSFAGGLVAPFFNVYFSEKLHLSTTLIGVLFALAAVLSIPGSLLGPRLIRRIGSVHAVIVVRLAIFPCLLGLALGGLVVGLAMVCFLFRFALIYTAGALDSHFTISSVPAHVRPLASGLRTGTYNLFWALGAWGAGEQIDRLGYTTIFLASAVLTVVACALFFGLFALPLTAPALEGAPRRSAG